MVKLSLHVKEFETILTRGGEEREAGTGTREEGTVLGDTLKMGVSSLTGPSYNYGL